MEKIALLTDSSCDLSLDTLKKHNIHLLPLRLIYDDKEHEEYEDKVTITSQEMYDRLKLDQIPTTSLPNAESTQAVIEKLIKEEYTHAIVICVSTKVSGTLNCIRLVCEEYKELNFHFFDTKTLGFPVGAIALEAATLLEKGYSFETIVSNLQDIRNRTQGFIAVDTLEYLIKGGRISKAKGTVGQFLHLKPIVSCTDEGTLYTYNTVRGRKKSLRKMKEIVQEYLEKSPCKIWVLNGDAKEEAIAFYNEIKDYAGITQISLEEIGPAMGVHTGPGTVGFTILSEQ